MNPWLGISLVLVLLVVSLQVLSFAQKRWGLNPELVRKSLHITMGLATLSFPFVFQEIWPVLLLTVVTMICMLALIKLPFSFAWKDVLCSANRSSYGEVCFPISVGTLFCLGHTQPLLFIIPMLTLTLADAASALVGKRYGLHSYHTSDGIKSTEGSIAFFTVAFLAAHVPLLLFSSTGRYESLCIGLILGGIAMLFEGIAWKGLDNFFIPMGTFLVLKTHWHDSAFELTIKLMVLMFVLLFTVNFKSRTTLNGSAIMGVALFAYFSWLLGGLAWLLMPLILFFGYKALLPQRFRELTSTHTIYAVISVASTGLIWLFYKSFTGFEFAIYPYTLGFAIHATIIAIARISGAALTKQRIALIVLAILRSWLLLFIPYVLLNKFDNLSLLETAIAPIFIALPTMAFYFSKPQQSEIKEPETSVKRWIRQGCMAAIGSTFGLLVVFFRSGVH